MPVGVMTIGKEFRFSASHALGHCAEGHPCRRYHGHNYRVVVELASRMSADNQGPQDPWVEDFGVLSQGIGAWIAENLDHRDLSSRLAELGIRHATAECLAWLVWKKATEIHRTNQHGDLNDYWVLAVTVHETDSCWARHEGRVVG